VGGKTIFLVKSVIRVTCSILPRFKKTSFQNNLRINYIIFFLPILGSDERDDKWTAPGKSLLDFKSKVEKGDSRKKIF